MNKDNEQEGQSTVEYLLLFAAVIAVMMVFLSKEDAGSYKNTLNNAFSTGINELQSVADTMQGGG